MDNYQEEKLSSYDRINIVCDNDPQTVATIPLFSKKIAELREIVSEIKLLATQQAQDITGLTSAKNNLLDDVATQMLDVSGAIHAYAVDKNDTVLMVKMDYKRSVVNKEDQTQIIIIADVVLAEAKKMQAADLEDCGISAAELKEFEYKLTTLKGSVNGKNIARIDQSSVTKRMGDLFVDAANLKNNSLDKLARQFERKSPDFYFKYKAAATLHHRSAKKTTDDTTNGNTAAS